MRTSPAAIRQAARHLREGRLVAFPTETVYGLGADATNHQAVRQLFRVKRRPADHPLIVHVADTQSAFSVGASDARAIALAERFWPGPLTLVLPALPASGIVPEVTGGRNTVGVRVPRHPVASALLSRFGGPVAAPSANPHGRISPTRAKHVRDDFEPAVDLVLDGGPAEIGLESTVLELCGEVPTLLRAGGIPVETLEAEIGPIAEPGARELPRAPGMLRQHYAPVTPLRLNAKTPLPDEVYLGFGPSPDAHRNLSPTATLEEAAQNLFAMLRELDTVGARRIAVAPIPDQHLGKAINDRLRRARCGTSGRATNS